MALKDIDTSFLLSRKHYRGQGREHRTAARASVLAAVRKDPFLTFHMACTQAYFTPVLYSVVRYNTKEQGHANYMATHNPFKAWTCFPVERKKARQGEQAYHANGAGDRRKGAGETPLGRRSIPGQDHRTDPPPFRYCEDKAREKAASCTFRLVYGVTIVTPSTCEKFVTHPFRQDCPKVNVTDFSDN